MKWRDNLWTVWGLDAPVDEGKQMRLQAGPMW
jgi:hypothetical protein